MAGPGGARTGAGRKSAVAEDATADAYVLYHRSRAKREAHKAKLAELDERNRKRELVEAAQVRRDADKAARLVRDAFSAIPDRLSAMLLGLTEEEIRNALREEIRSTLTSISDAMKHEDTETLN